MKQNPGFFLTKIHNTPYLLPYGQTIAEHRNGVKINQTGADIWNILVNDIPFTELLQVLSKRYEIAASEREEFERDILAYVQRLEALGIISNTEPDTVLQDCGTYLIGGILLCFYGEKDLISPEFASFAGYEAGLPTQKITLSSGVSPATSKRRTLLMHPQLCVYETLLGYELTFPESKGFSLMTISRDGTDVHCYCDCIDEETIFDVFCGIRISFLYICMQYEKVALHSASLLYNGKAWLFSGSSGTGKSTHTNLWKELCDVSLLNGDVNLISKTASGYEVMGIPWCGTSGIFTTDLVPLGGIVLLKQSPSNEIIPISKEDATLFTMQRLISPTWTKEQVTECLTFTSCLQEKVPVIRYGCNISKDAVWTLKSYLDGIKDDYHV